MHSFIVKYGNRPRDVSVWYEVVSKSEKNREKNELSELNRGKEFRIQRENYNESKDNNSLPPYK